jgi:SAM-dependent methyltransferase
MTERVERGGGEWLDRNRARWDELVPIHVASEMYDQTALREGRASLTPLEERELPTIAPDGWGGLRVLHLQCHFGADTLVLAQRGADVVGLDFSLPAIHEARRLAAEVGLEDRARFVHANVYDARHVLPEPDSFDVVYTTWGTIGWLPDVAEWARIIAWFLKPGGRLYFADGHPAAFVFEAERGSTELPVFTYAYETEGRADVIDEAADYADAEAEVTNSVTWEWAHPMSETVTALLDAGLRIDFLHEHYEIPWQMFGVLEKADAGQWRWPAERWLPLSYSVAATKV